jgi:hypothetical protein
MIVSEECILNGDSWSVRLVKGRYLLEYVSGELAGRMKTLVITKSDFEGLQSGELTVDHILASHNSN